MKISWGVFLVAEPGESSRSVAHGYGDTPQEAANALRAELERRRADIHRADDAIRDALDGSIDA